MSAEENGLTLSRRRALGLAGGALAGAAVLASAPRAARAAASLRTGTWKINANGFKGNLEIAPVDAQGRVSGTVFGNPIRGFWDEDAKRITFMRIPNASVPSSIQVYTGYMFRNSLGSDAEFTLAGYFESFSGTGSTTAQRNVFGWFATIFVIG